MCWSARCRSSEKHLPHKRKYQRARDSDSRADACAEQAEMVDRAGAVKLAQKQRKPDFPTRFRCVMGDRRILGRHQKPPETDVSGCDQSQGRGPLSANTSKSCISDDDKIRRPRPESRACAQCCVQRGQNGLYPILRPALSANSGGGVVSGFFCDRERGRCAWPGAIERGHVACAKNRCATGAGDTAVAQDMAGASRHSGLGVPYGRGTYADRRNARCALETIVVRPALPSACPVRQYPPYVHGIVTWHGHQSRTRGVTSFNVSSAA